MKRLKIIEKSRSFWYLLGISLAFFILRLPSLIEPNWYGDEGIYQVIGKALSNGRLLYAQIWDNKPPLLYIVYAMFHGDQFQVRFFSLIVGLLATSAFFYLSKSLFSNLKATVISTLFFAVLFAIPLLEGNIANAENFMLLPILGAGLLIYKITSKNYKLPTTNKLFIAGLLLGLAFLFKIVAIFDLAAFCVYLFIALTPESFSFSFSKIKIAVEKSIKPIFLILFGFLLPLLITAFYFLVNHAFSDFAKAAFSSNVRYVGYGNNFIIPQGFLILKLLLLGSVAFLIFWKRKKISNSTVFILIWFAFSVFNTFFSGRPYTHYTLVLLPSFCLLIGLAFNTKTKLKYAFLCLAIFSAIFINNNFKLNLDRTFKYYGNTLSFLSGQKSLVDYQAFFDQKTPRDYEIASFIKTHTSPSDNVFIWGDSAQIYALSEKLPPGKYTVAYHIKQYKMALNETQLAFSKARPKYVVVLSESQALPFYMPNYASKFVFKNALIYERNF